MVESRKINPWTWQDQFGFSQAIETSGHKRVLRCSDQTAVNANGEPQHAGDIAKQPGLALDNLEAVLKEADMTLANLVRLNLYTTDIDGVLQHYELVEHRLKAAGIQPAVTLLASREPELKLRARRDRHSAR